MGLTVIEKIVQERPGLLACMLGGDDDRTQLLCAAPDFGEQTRRAAHEAVLLAATVDVPHAGRP